jgi:hypothetical protein
MDDEARSLAEDAGEPLSTTAAAAAAGGAADIDDSLYSRQRYVLVSARPPTLVGAFKQRDVQL